MVRGYENVGLPTTFLATPPKLCVRLPGLVPSLYGHVTNLCHLHVIQWSWSHDLCMQTQHKS